MSDDRFSIVECLGLNVVIAMGAKRYGHSKHVG